MDDSIYRDFYGAAGQTKVWWEWVQPYLISDFAIHFYIITSCLITLGNSLLLALTAKIKLTEIKDESFDFKFPGPHPQNEDTLDKRRKVLDEMAAEVWAPYYKAAFSLLAFGLIIPITGFILICTNYLWFDTTNLPFINLETHAQTQTTDVTTFAIFIMDQIGRGALFDTFEVFDYNPSMITNNSDNFLFSSIVLLFRFVISAFGAALAVAIYETISMRIAMKKKFDEQIEIYKTEAEAKKKAKAFNSTARAA